MKKALILLVAILITSCNVSEKKQEEVKNDLNIDQVIETLGDSITFDWAERSYSPLYSNIGLVFIDRAGLPGVYFHYNYRNVAIKNVLEINEDILDFNSDLLGTTQKFKNGEARYSFYDINSFLVEIDGLDDVKVNFNPKKKISISGLGEYKYKYTPWVEKQDGEFLFKGYMPNRDKRDPDPMYPISMGVKILNGSVSEHGAEGIDVKQKEGKILIAISFQVGDIDNYDMIKKLASAPSNIETARQITKDWFAKALKDLPLTTGNQEEQRIAAMASMVLTFNACVGNGYLEDRIATFPNRGNYATQYEWDAAFQNLAYEMMDPGLAEDAMLILTESARPDGKIGQFVASTYLRPIEVQVPLTGWASKRLYEKRGDKEFAKKVLYPLVKNNDWMLDNRMTHFGLISTLSPWELWDDTPRLDSGAIIACDFNADLLMQIQACEFLAREIGDIETANECKKQADKLANKMVEVIYDKEANIFRDVLVENGEMLSIITPANFVPLLADVPISDEKAKDMVRTYLLDTTKMFGYVPFPSVAYDEESYVPCKPGACNHLTWRGPTWMPMAWMMLQVLDKYGFEEEYNHAANRIFDLLVQDGELHELFNSQTGEGIGIPQLGWTAAIYLKLKDELGR